METFKDAQARILRQLAELGWKTTPNLKVPHATSVDGSTRLWFKPQAVYFTGAPKHQFNEARSLHVEIRDASVESLVRHAGAFVKSSTETV